MSQQEPVFGQPQMQAQNPAMMGQQPQFTPEQMAAMQAMLAQQGQQPAPANPAQQAPVHENPAQQMQGMPNVGGMAPLPGTIAPQGMPGQEQHKPELPNNFPGMGAPAEMPANPNQDVQQMNHMGMGQQQMQHPQMSPEQMNNMQAQQQYNINQQYGQQAAAPTQQQTMPGMNPNYNPQGYVQQAAHQEQAPNYGQPAPMGQSVGQQQYQAPAQQYAPQGQFPGQQGMPGQGYPGQQQYAPQGQQAPGYNGGSYLNNGGGVGGHTPTGHAEKQKFNGRALLVFASAADSKKQNRYCRGLLNPNPDQRNGQSYNFICFSKHSAYQIDILENQATRANFTRLEKAAGQVILFEGAWEWNAGPKGQPAWQLMIESFTFEADPNLKLHADNYVPPVPPSPMDMMNGGNMGMMGMGQQPMGGYPQQPQQQYNPQMQQQGYPQGQAPMGGQYNPYPGQQNPAAGYQPQGQFPGQQGMSGQGYPGMPGQHQ